MGFLNLGKLAKNVGKAVAKGAHDTVKQVKRSGQDVADEASRHKTALAAVAALSGVGLPVIAAAGAAAGAAKRGGGLKDALRGGGEAAAVGGGVKLLKAGATAVLKRGSGDAQMPAPTPAPAQSPVPVVSRPEIVQTVTRADKVKGLGGFPGSSAVLKAATELPVIATEEITPGVFRAVNRARGERSMLNANRDKGGRMESPAVAAITAGPGSEMASTQADAPPAGSVADTAKNGPQWVPIVAVVVVAVVMLLIMSRKKAA